MTPAPSVTVLERAITETAWMRTVVQYATLHGWLCYHTFRSTHSPSGFPDLCLVRPSATARLVFAELKAETGKLTPTQEAWLIALRGVPGVEVFCWRPSDWPAVRDALR